MKFKFNIPNKITLLRVSLIPLFAAVLLADIPLPQKNLLASFIFGMLSVSDFFDGYIARKKKQVTKIGALIDPIADKLLISTALVFLVGKGVPLWMAAAIIAREVVITVIRIYLLPSRIVIPASNFGKAKTVVQSIAIALVLLKLPFSYYAMLTAVLLTLGSGLEYLVKIKARTGNKIVNLPNLITLARLLLIPSFIYYFLKGEIQTAIIFFGTIALTDKLDGISARMMKQMTKAGSIFDSFTDWTFLLVSVIMFLYSGYGTMAYGISLIIPIVLTALLKIFYLKKFKQVLTSVVSKMTIGIGYATILTLLIDFYYKNIMLTITLAFMYLTLAVFVFKVIKNSSRQPPDSK